MDTNAVRWFQQVADGVTVTEVSDLEDVTQSGVSRALARLEAEVGTPLLSKSGRTLRMTSAGAAFKKHVDAMLHALDDGLAAVEQLVDPETGTVTLAFQFSLGTWLVPDLISSFRQDHPDVRFELLQMRGRTAAPPLLTGRADLEISPVRRSDDSVRWRRLVTEPLRLAVAATHPLVARAVDSISLAELRTEPFVMLRSGSILRQLSLELCERAGYHPVIAFEGEDLPTARAFVAAGLGVAIVPAPRQGSADIVDGPLRFLPLTDDGASRELGLAWSGQRRLLPAADLFRRHAIARAAAGRLPALAGS